MPLADPAVISDPQRVERLHQLMRVDHDSTPLFTRLTRLAAQLINAPAAFIALVDADQQIFAAQVGLPEAYTASLPLSHSFCQHVAATGEPLIIEDAALHPLVYDNPAISDLKLLAYAGLPLKLADGTLLGVFGVFDHRPRRWKADELALLDDLAAAAMSELELRARIVERDRAQQALGESRRFADEIVRAVPDVIYVYDIAQDRMIFTNRDVREMLGYGDDMRDQFMPQTLWRTLIALMHEDERQAILSLREQLFESRDQTDATEIEMRLQDVDGSWRWFTSRDVIFERDEHDQPIKLLGVLHDISQRKQSDAEQKQQTVRQTMLRRIEAELSKSLELDSVLTVAMDAALRVTNASDGCIALLEDDLLRVMAYSGGYQPAMTFFADEGMIGRAVRLRKPEFIRDVTRDPDYVPYIAHTQAKMVIPLLYRDRVIGVICLETPKAERFTIEAFEFLKLIIARVSSSLENARLFALTESNLKELEALYGRVRGLEQLKTDMIRIAAHDLRNPLSVILGFSQLLLADARTLAPTETDMVETILRSAYKMQKIITDILSLERIEAMQNGMVLERVEMDALVAQSAADFEPRAHEKGLQFALEAAESPVHVVGDAAQLREAVDNLVSNAIKYTPDGGSVRLRVQALADMAIIEVEDTGYGIPDDQQAKLFEPFYRAQTGETQAIEGTGLGLHLVQNIVTRHNGNMRFRSEYGVGSTFGFVLPLNR